MSEPTLAEVLADLNRAKATFQLQALKTTLGIPADEERPIPAELDPEDGA